MGLACCKLAQDELQQVNCMLIPRDIPSARALCCTNRLLAVNATAIECSDGCTAGDVRSSRDGSSRMTGESARPSTSSATSGSGR